MAIDSAAAADVTRLIPARFIPARFIPARFIQSALPRRQFVVLQPIANS
jgi:hypothetical protein